MADQASWLVVGLGNPGSQYEFTPHNLGFLTVDRVAVANNVRISRKECMALVGSGTIAGESIVLAKPQTYMNVSGPSVKGLLEKYQVQLNRLLLVFDDLDLPWTAVRVKLKGSGGSHNGVNSVIQAVGSTEFPRVRLGVHPGILFGNGADFLLSPIKKAQFEELDELLDHAARAVESVIAEGVEKSMAKYNRRARGLTEEDK